MAGQLLSHSDRFRVQILALFVVLYHFAPHDPSTFTVLPIWLDMHKISYPDRIRQKIGRIGKALNPGPLLSLELGG